MPAAASRTAVRKGPAACSGCSLCLLVCPVWRESRDPRLSPEGRAKALQHGAPAGELAASAKACRLCGACEPVCPERIDLIGMTLDLRARLADTEDVAATQARMKELAACARPPAHATTVFLPGPALRARPDRMEKIASLLGATACADGGEDIAHAVASGIGVPGERLRSFLAHLRGAQSIIVEDGLWMRHLRAWLPGMRLASLGEALGRLDSVRRGLRRTDLYVIEPRAYHGDYERLVRYYDRLGAERGCTFNLDLQRIAIPAAGQADWILKGRTVERIVVERQDDAEPFVALGRYPVVHLADLADH